MVRSILLRIGLLAAFAIAPLTAAAMPASAADARIGAFGSATALGAADYHLESVLDGFDHPLDVVSSSQPNKLYVVEQSGRIRVATRASRSDPWRRAGVFLDLRALVSTDTLDRGLLGLVFAPDYATSGLFYVFYTDRATGTKPAGDIALAEYHRRTATRADRHSPRIVLRVPHATSFHKGGWMEFGPDGHLYVSIGDAGIGRLDLPQDVHSRFGKILRIDPRDPPGPARYGVPAGNPFVGVSGQDDVWAVGLRNPWRASFDPATGQLWVGDVGQDRFEEIDRVNPGESVHGHAINFGWSNCEARHSYPSGSLPDLCDGTGSTLPIVEYPHGASGVTTEDDCSVIGGFVYRGVAQPALVGRYFYGDFCTGRIWAIAADHEFADAVPVPLDTDLLITSFGEDRQGELYVVDRAGGLRKVVQN